MIYRKFIAIILGLSVAIAGLSAAPARAGDRDLLKILGGVAAVAIIGSAIANAKDRDDHVTRNNYYYNKKPRVGHRHGHRHHTKHRYHKYGHKKHDHGYKHRSKHHNGHFARPLPKRVQRKVLPASCRVQAYNERGRFVAFSDWCLDRKFRYANALPRRCATGAHVQRHNRRTLVYSQRCLSRQGYAVAQY